MSNEINQKAKELVEKYSIIEIQIGGQYDGYLNMQIEDAKQCALIDVQHTIDTINDILKITYNSVVAKKLGECISIKQAIEQL